MKNIKIAFCFATEIRDGHLLHNSIKNLLAGNENYNLDVDYYLQTWNHTSIKYHNKYDEHLSLGLFTPSDLSIPKRVTDEVYPIDTHKYNSFINNYQIKKYRIDNENEYYQDMEHTKYRYWNLENMWTGLNITLNQILKSEIDVYDIVAFCRPDICFHPSAKLVDKIDHYLENINNTIFHHSSFIFFSTPQNIKNLMNFISTIDVESEQFKQEDYSPEKIYEKAGFKSEEWRPLHLGGRPTILRPETSHLNPIDDWDEIFRINFLLYN